MLRSWMILASFAWLSAHSGLAAEKLSQAEGNVTAIRQDSFVILNDKGENVEFRKEIHNEKDFPKDLEEGDHVSVWYRMDATKVQKKKRAQAPGKSGVEPIPTPLKDDRIFYES